MRRSIKYALPFLALAVATAPAQAAWLKAKTDHFIIDADTNEPLLRNFAGKLERFDRALRTLYGVADDPARRANPVHVYAVSEEGLKQICGGQCPSAGAVGYYRPRAGGSVIFTAVLSAHVGDTDLDAQEVLLHEYSHHFMYSNYPIAYPLWYSEGFAEFNANVSFKPDGAVVIGRPAKYRAWGIRSDLVLTTKQLFDPPARIWTDLELLNKFYGRSWLLVHYLTLNPDRRSQLAAYLDELNHGKSSLDAASAAFGDINRLGMDLEHYLSVNKLEAALQVPPGKAPMTIEISAVSPGEAAMMGVHMRSTFGVTPQMAKSIVAQAQVQAKPFPANAIAQVELAEAEFDAHNLDAADAAADRALKADPAGIETMLYKGRVAVQRAVLARTQDPAAWKTARSWYLMANHAAPDAAEPLLLYYESFIQAGAAPSPNATMGLERAAVLAPEDSSVRWLLAGHMLATGDPALARRLLQPIAFAPHDNSGDNVARKAIDLIDAKDVTGAIRTMKGNQAKAG